MDLNATAILQKQEEEKTAWWAETVRRCEEAARHPERLIDAERVFRGVREEIGTSKGKLGRS
jgi:hypothetical protein